MATFLGRSWTRRELLERVGSIEQLAGIRAVTEAGGKAQGVRSFEVYTASGLTFRVLADRALDISSCHYRGLPLAWTSPAGDVHPSYYEGAGSGWLRSFGGGLVVTCGLDQFGAPATDKGEDLGLHGRIGNLPAHEVSHKTRWRGDDLELEIFGVVRQARLFGEHLVLERRIVTRLGSKLVCVEDLVTNEGFTPQPHMILYHCNLGFPLVSERSRLHLEAEATTARDADAEAGLSEWRSFQAPTPGYREQVFQHIPKADAEGRVTVLVENPDLGLGLRMGYAKDSLPQLFQWKMMGQGAYVLGLEPANCSGIEGRAAARGRNDLPQLEPGESRGYTLTFEVMTTAGYGR